VGLYNRALRGGCALMRVPALAWLVAALVRPLRVPASRRCPPNQQPAGSRQLQQPHPASSFKMTPPRSDIASTRLRRYAAHPLQTTRSLSPPLSAGCRPTDATPLASPASTAFEVAQNLRSFLSALSFLLNSSSSHSGCAKISLISEVPRRAEVRGK